MNRGRAAQVAKVAMAALTVALAAIGGTAHAASATSDGSCAAAVENPFGPLSDVTRWIAGTPVGPALAQGVVHVGAPIVTSVCESKIRAEVPGVDAAKSCACMNDAIDALPAKTLARWIAAGMPSQGDPAYDAFVSSVESRCMIPATPEPPKQPSPFSSALSSIERAFTGAVHAIEAAPGRIAGAVADGARSLFASTAGSLVKATLDVATNDGIAGNVCRDEVKRSAPGMDATKFCGCATRELAGVPSSTLGAWALHGTDLSAMQHDPQFIALESRVETCAAK